MRTMRHLLLLLATIITHSHTRPHKQTYITNEQTQDCPIPTNLTASHCNSLCVYIHTHSHQETEDAPQQLHRTTHCNSSLCASHCNSIHTHTFSPRDTRHTPIAAPHVLLQLTATHCNSLQLYIYTCIHTHILTKRHTTHPNSCNTYFFAAHCNALQIIATQYLYIITHTHSHKDTHDTP